MAVPVARAIPLGTATPIKVHVTPGTGGPRTAFKLSFRSPTQTGAMGSVRRSDRVEISGTHRPGCVWSGQMALPAAGAQQMVRVSLTPAGVGGAGARTWCTGTFRGSVVQSEHLMCAPPHLCPMIEIRPQTIAHFSFRVTRRS